MSNQALLVEDDPDLARLLARILRDLGWEVEHASTAKEGLQFAWAGPVDLLVTEINMGGMAGLKQARRIRRLDPGVRVVVLCGLADSVDKAIAAGFTTALKKPFDLKAFRNAVGAPGRQAS